MPKEAFALKLEGELLAWIRIEAMKENRSVNNWIETTLKEKKNEMDSIIAADSKLHEG